MSTDLIRLDAATLGAKIAAKEVSSTEVTRACLDQIVCHQPEPGVPHGGLNSAGLACRLGLPTQGPELSSQLGGQVRHPREIGGHRF